MAWHTTSIYFINLGQRGGEREKKRAREEGVLSNSWEGGCSDKMKFSHNCSRTSKSNCNSGQTGMAQRQLWRAQQKFMHMGKQVCGASSRIQGLSIDLPLLQQEQSGEGSKQGLEPVELVRSRPPMREAGTRGEQAG